MTPHRTPRAARGLSLIELMVTVLVGSLLILGLVEVFAASRLAYQLSQGLARTQENGRFAMDFLQRDLRMAGHLGCVNDQARFLPENDQGSRSALTTTFATAANLLANDYATGVNLPLRFDLAVQGYEANTSAPGNTVALTANPTVDTTTTAWTPNLPADMAAAMPNRVRGSDILVLRYFAPTGAQVTDFTPDSPTATITVDSTQWGRLTEGVTNPGIFGVADCMNAGVFNATTANANTGVITVTAGTAKKNQTTFAGLTSFVPGQAVVYRAESVAYYVGRNATTGQPSLYRVRFNLPLDAASGAVPTSTAEELVEGIESLQVRYAQDTRTAANERPTGNMATAVTASGVLPAADPATAWRRVGLVQVGLIARSPDPAAAQPRGNGAPAFSALQTTFTVPDDKRHRSVYEASVALRNRLFGN